MPPTKKAVPTKKAAVKKAPTKSVSKAPGKPAAATKAPTKPTASKTVPGKRTASTKTVAEGRKPPTTTLKKVLRTGPKDKYGFTEGSQVSKISAIVATETDPMIINKRVKREVFGRRKMSDGADPNITVAVGSARYQLKKRGFTFPVEDGRSKPRAAKRTRPPTKATIKPPTTTAKKTIKPPVTAKGTVPPVAAKKAPTPRTRKAAAPKIDTPVGADPEVVDHLVLGQTLDGVEQTEDTIAPVIEIKKGAKKKSIKKTTSLESLLPGKRATKKKVAGKK